MTGGRNLSVSVSVDGISVEVPVGATLLDAARAAGAEVPTLCFDARQAPFGACRVCLVAVDGGAPVPACTTPCREGMAIDTRDARSRRIAANVVELVLSELPEPPAEHTELAAVARQLEVGAPRWTGAVHEPVAEPRHPYLALRHELCISCGRCVRACDEVQGAFALTATGRGFHANVAAGLGSGFRDSTCVSCGACADTCPTEAIAEVALLELAEAGGGEVSMAADRFDATVTTTCGYCGVGCRLEAHALDGAVASITPALDGPANEGHTCLKGRFAHRFSRHRERLTAPLMRSGRDQELRPVSWEAAIARIVDELTRIKAEHGPDAVAGLASSRATNEDCYVMARFMRAAVGTHNIDNCSRVCHSPTSWALRRSLGLSGATGSFADIDAADAAIIIGANPTEGHPVVGARIKQAAIAGCRLVTIDPRRIELADYGVLHLSPRPGTNAAVLLGLAHVVARDGLTDRAFLDARTEGYDAVEELVADYTPSEVQRISGVPAADLEHAAHIYGEAGEASILWGLGVTEHKYGSEVVRLICNLALMCGKVGRPGSALLPLRGQNNVQGSSDMGALPDTFTAYRSVTDETTARAFEAAWGVSMRRAPGLTIPQMFDAAVGGTLKAMYIFGEDVAQTDPNTSHVVAALEALDFLVCQDIFETETTRYADVVLPASAFLEKTGTFTNAERRIQLVEAATDPPGQARTDFDIITTLSRAMGHDMGLATPADAMAEIAALTPDFAGVTYERIGRRGLQWPVAADGTDAPILYAERFARPGSDRAELVALDYRPPGSEASEEFPLVLVTGRRLQHYNAGTMTRRTANLELMDRDLLEIHPDDATRLWIADGELVSVRSPHGRIEIGVRITDRIERGHVFCAFHFPEVRTNLLIGSSADVNTSCPEYKVQAVDVRPMPEVPTARPAVSTVS